MADTRSLSSSPDLQNRVDSHQVTPPLSPLSKPAKPSESPPHIAASSAKWSQKLQPERIPSHPLQTGTSQTPTTMHTTSAIAIEPKREPSPGLWNAPGTSVESTPLHPLHHRPSSSKSSTYQQHQAWRQPQLSDMTNPQIVIRRVSHQPDEEPASRPESSRGNASDNEDLSKSLDIPGHHRKSSHGEQDLQSIDEGEVVGTIDLVACPSTWLVGFEDRPNDMKRIMELPQNKPIFDEIRHRVGSDAYDNQLIPLWTQTTREQMGDIHWLVKSRRVILPDLDVPEYFKFIWRRFAGVVGWEGNDKDLDIGRRASTRQNSTASFSSNSSRRLDSYWE